MDNLALERLKEVLVKNDKIDIVVCKNPDIDQMGAALGLYLSLINSGKKASVICQTQPIVEISNLVGIDKVKPGIEGETGDLVVSFPYKEGEIEKISYTLENSLLNIIVKAGEKGLSFDQNDIQFRRSEGSSRVIISIGMSKLADLEDIIPSGELAKVTLVNIDNKNDNQGFGDIVLVSGNLSISEGIASMISSLNLKIDDDTSQNLLSGIIEATDNFQNPKTSPLALEMSAYLMKNGAARFQRMPFVKKESVLEEETVIRSSSDNKTKIDTNNPPEDWLTPKIYKGSTSI